MRKNAYPYAWMLGAMMCMASGANAANTPEPNSDPEPQSQSFQEFRQKMLSDFSSFRDRILDQYADFLNGEWHEYEPLKPQERYEKPKPKSVPKVDKPATPTKPTAPTAPSQPTKPTAPTTPSQPTKPTAPTTPSQPTKPTAPTTPSQPTKPTAPTAPIAPAAPVTDNGEKLHFYDIPYVMPKYDFTLRNKLMSTSAYADQWTELASNKVAEKLVPSFQNIAKAAGFNDYLIYKLVESYMNEKFPSKDDTSRMAATHYILANMGYDAHIAMTGSGVPLLLLPTKQDLYGINYMMLNGEKYYVFVPEGYQLNQVLNDKIYTCSLPEEASKAAKFDFVLGALNLPVKEKAFDLQYGPIHLTGAVNENIMPIIYHYPQMPMGEYAKSNLDPKLRSSLVNQMKEQLADLSSDEQADKLLSFMHNVFDYATDQESHGFEKPYFVEEMLYYPQNDCEDRAIFYTYFLWNAFGKDAQLINFPGHEAAAVNMSRPVNGYSYDYAGKTFYISDPTYIGATTGMIMPMYENVNPKVDYTYSQGK